MSFFDEFLKSKVATEDRSIFEKYPELQQSVSKMESDLGTVSRYAGQWVDWQNQNWDPQAGMTKAEKQLRDELSAAQTRLAVGMGTGADPDEIAKLRKEMEAKVAEVQQQSTKQIEGMNYFYQAVSNRLLPHQQEFKENLKAQDLMNYMQANKINDPDTAYDKMVAGRRAELAAQREKELNTKHAADLEAARTEGYNKRAQEVAMGPGGMLPTDQTGGIAGITAHVGGKAPTISDDEKAFIANAKLESGELAKLGYQMFKRGDFGPVQ